MKAEEILKSKPSTKIGIDDYYGFHTIIKAMEEYASLKVAEAKQLHEVKDWDIENNFTKQQMILFIEWYDNKDEADCHRTYEEEFNQFLTWKPYIDTLTSKTFKQPLNLKQMKTELIFREQFEKGMKSNDFEAFKRTHPTLLKCILEALKVAEAKQLPTNNVTEGKTNKEIINMHMNGQFEQLHISTQNAILSAMNESNSEACLNYAKTNPKNWKWKEAEFRTLLNDWNNTKFSFSRMVEIVNERLSLSSPEKQKQDLKCSACNGHGWNGMAEDQSTCTICEGTGGVKIALPVLEEQEAKQLPEVKDWDEVLKEYKVYLRDKSGRITDDFWLIQWLKQHYLLPSEQNQPIKP